MLTKLSGVGFALSLPAYHGLPCIKILIVGVSAIIHFFPNGMLASDKEPLGKTVCVICQLISSLSLSVTGRFSRSPLADGETEAQNRGTSLSLLIANTTMDSPYQTTSRHHPHVCVEGSKNARSSPTQKLSPQSLPTLPVDPLLEFTALE